MLRHVLKRPLTRLSTSVLNTRVIPTATKSILISTKKATVSREFHSTCTQLFTSPNHYNITELTTDRYHKLADDILEHIVGNLEEIGDNTDLPGFDIEYSQGVMTISLGEHGTYVVNKQPPNHQIWLSSPISGPQRYDYDEAHHKWFYHRDNHTLDEVLNNELSKAFGEEIDVLKGYEPERH